MGARTVTMAIGTAFALVLIGFSFVSEIVGLTVGFTGVQMAGQSALTLAATTAVARAVRHRRRLTLGITGAIGSAGISLAPIGLERLIASVGIHNAWRWEAALVAVVVIPLAFFFPRRTLPVDPSARVSTGQIAIQAESWTLSEAVRSKMFSVISASVATAGMLTTTLAFHQIAILGKQGLDPLEAATNFLPQTITAILATVLAGSLIDRINPNWLIMFSMTTRAGALLMLRRTCALKGWPTSARSKASRRRSDSRRPRSGAWHCRSVRISRAGLLFPRRASPSSP